MSASESPQGLTWWAKLAFWGAVITVGGMYLSQVNRSGPVGRPAAAQPKVEAGVSAQRPAAAAQRLAAGEAQAAPPAVATPAEIPRPVVAPALGPTEAASRGPASVRGAATRAPQAGTQTSGKAQNDEQGKASEGAGEVSHAEAQAFAKAVLSAPKAPDDRPASAPDASPAPGLDAPVNRNKALTERQARILNEYERMRRAAEAEQRRWRGARRPPPMTPYGAYPYAPGYYYPQGR